MATDRLVVGGYHERHLLHQQIRIRRSAWRASSRTGSQFLAAIERLLNASQAS